MDWFVAGRRGGKTVTVALAEAEDRVQRLERLLEAAQTEKALLTRMLADAHDRIAGLHALAAQNALLERHNATYQTSVQWAIAHINTIGVERASLIDFVKSGVASAHPMPMLEWQEPVMAPPPGPIGAAGVVGGMPIPDGQTAGDVLGRLRARRDVERAARPVDPAELLKAAADLFNEPPAGVDQAATPSDPFADIP